MDLELHLDLLSQPCRAVYIFAKKNNIAFDFKFVSLRAGQQYSEEFGQVNLLRRVPALKDGDFMLAESVAILKYLAGKYRTPNHWYPSDLQLRARVDEYLAWQHMAIRFQGSRLFCFKGLLPLLTGKPIPKERMDEAVEDLQSSIQLLEDKFLQDRPYIVGQEVSLADLVAIVELMQPLGVGFDPFANRPKLAAWRDRVTAALGKELFDEAHEQVLKSGGAQSNLDLQSPAMQRLAKNLKKRYSHFQLLEDKFLQDRPYIVGQEVSLADLVAIVELMQPLGVGFDPFANRPKLAAWRDRVTAALGKELFDEAHEQVLKSGGAQSNLDLQSPALQRLAKNLKKRYR